MCAIYLLICATAAKKNLWRNQAGFAVAGPAQQAGCGDFGTLAHPLVHTKLFIFAIDLVVQFFVDPEKGHRQSDCDLEEKDKIRK